MLSLLAKDFENLVIKLNLVTMRSAKLPHLVIRNRNPPRNKIGTRLELPELLPHGRCRLLQDIIGIRAVAHQTHDIGIYLTLVCRQ